MIDFERYILMILPRSLRRIGIYSFLSTLLSEIRDLYIFFTIWRASQIIRESGSPQTCMLKRIVYDQLGIVIDIEEDIGSPNDFIVKSNTTDVNIERQLYALINAYKLAGRSFMLSNIAVTFSQLWGGYVCETESITQSWGSYVCEKILLPINDINITIRIVDNNLTDTWITVEASLFPVSCQLNVIAEYEGSTYIKETIDYADTNPGHIAYTVDRQAGETIQTVEPAVSEDEFYRYVTHITFITE